MSWKSFWANLRKPKPCTCDGCQPKVRYQRPRPYDDRSPFMSHKMSMWVANGKVHFRTAVVVVKDPFGRDPF